MHKNIISLLCQYGLFIHTCMSENAIVSKDGIFFLLWHNLIRWTSHIYQRSSYPWSTNCLKNFSISVLMVKVWKWWNIAEFPKISIKRKNFNTFYEAQTSSWPNEIIQPPTRWKLPLRLWNINFLTEMYRNIQTFTFPVLRESSSWASRNGAVQTFFLTPTRNVC